MEALKQRFIKLFEASGWTQAEAARRLEMTRGGVNGIITGNTVPSPGAVKLLELLVAENGNAVAHEIKQSGPSYGVEAKLAALPENERAEVLEIFNAIVQQAERRVSYTKKRAKPGAPGSAAS